MSWSFKGSGNFGGYTTNPTMFPVIYYNYSNLLLFSLMTQSLRSGGVPTVSGNSYSYNMTQAYTTQYSSGGGFYLEMWYYINPPSDLKGINIPNSTNKSLFGMTHEYESTQSNSYVISTGTTFNSTGSTLPINCSYNNMIFIDSIAIGDNILTTPNHNKNYTGVSSGGASWATLFSQWSTGETIGTVTFTWTFNGDDWDQIIIGFLESGGNLVYFDTVTKQVILETTTNYVEYQI